MITGKLLPLLLIVAILLLIYFGVGLTLNNQFPDELVRPPVEQLEFAPPRPSIAEEGEPKRVGDTNSQKKSGPLATQSRDSSEQKELKESNRTEQPKNEEPPVSPKAVAKFPQNEGTTGAEGLDFTYLNKTAQLWTEWSQRVTELPTAGPSSATEWAGLPSVTMWVRTFTPDNRKLLTVLFESAALFVPKEAGGWVITLDDESPLDHRFAKDLSRVVPFPRVKFQPEPSQNIFPGTICGRSRGYDRQMYSGFYADTWADTDVVAILDSDSLFLAPVLPQGLFGSNKLPKVIGKQTIYKNGRPFQYGPANGRWAIATETALGLQQAADFMWNFPVLIWKKDFAKVRAHVAKVHNTTFEAAFRKIASEKSSYCQIHILLNWAWYFNRGEYNWHLQSMAGSTAEMKNGTYNQIAVRVATHARGMSPQVIWRNLRQAFCFACLRTGSCFNQSAALVGQATISNWLFEAMFIWEGQGVIWTEPAMHSKGSPDQYQSLYYRTIQQKGFRFTESLPLLMGRDPRYYSDCEPVDNSACLDYNERMHRIRAMRAKKNWVPKLISVFMNICAPMYNSSQRWELGKKDQYNLKRSGNGKGNFANLASRIEKKADELAKES